MSDNVLTALHDVREVLSTGRFDGCLVQEVDLSRDGLPKVEASDTTFRKVALHDADASDGDFSRTKFSECSARGARFDRGRFRGCSFFAAELIEASFAGATMAGTSFYSSRMGNADFSGTRLQSPVFNSCELFGVKFRRSLVVNALFEAQQRGNVTLDRADFTNAVLIDCDLGGANLFGASFENALLVKVDLRQANIAQANFSGARLIDVQLDVSQLEPAERRDVEAAKVDDPWRIHGFMHEILAQHDDAELRLMIEYLLRTYLIEGAAPNATGETLPGIVANLKARFDFPELDALRVRGGNVQVRHGNTWYDLGAPIVVEAGGTGPTPSSSDAGSSDDSPAGSSPSGGRRAIDLPEPAGAEPAKEKGPPKSVKRSKRFRKLELD